MKPDMYADFVEACNSIADLACLQPKEKVCILADAGVEPDVLYGLFAAARLRRAEPYLCLVENPRHEGIPGTVVGAVSEANVVFHSWPAGGDTVSKRLRDEKGQRWVAIGDCRTLERFVSEAVRMPQPILGRLITSTWALIDQGQQSTDIHITDAKGTDLRLTLSRQELDRLHDDPRWQGQLRADGISKRAHIPSPHGPNLFQIGMDISNNTISGTVRYDAIVGFSGAYNGGFGDSTFVEPVTVQVQDTKVTSVKGGWEATALSSELRGEGRLVEIGMGFNPKVPAYGGRFTGIAGGNRSGSLHVATGGPKGEHADGILQQATVTVNGRTIVNRGHLVALDQPEVQQLAMGYQAEGGTTWLMEVSEDRELQRYR